MTAGNRNLLLCYFGMLLVFELVVRAWAVKPFWGLGLGLLILLCAAGACLLYCCTLLLPGKGRRPAAAVLTCGAAFICAVQIVYNSYFDTYCTVYSMAQGGQVAEFWRDILLEIVACAVPLLILVAGAAGALWFQRRKVDLGRQGRRVLWQAPAGAALCALLCLALVFAGGKGPNSPFDTLFRSNSLDASVRNFGVGAAFLLDAQRLAFGFSPQVVVAAETLGDALKEAEEPEPETVYEPNIMDIDFAGLAAAETNGNLAAMHQYFASVEPTLQNEKTGLFAGKNLVFVCGESFSSYAIHEKYTPTLYKLQTEGFTFTNFYNPIWGVSTIDGEYVTTQGLIPKNGVWSQRESATNWLPFTMGNQFRKLGYKTLAYHNHYAEYYGRTESHPNLGYTYKGLGTGLKVTEMWPESDRQMLELTTGTYVGPEPFHVYYMTVSGHKNYNFGGQLMCARHRDKVADLEMSTACQAYIACNIELDLAMEWLLQELTAAGALEDTVIVISGDHYPYGLTNEEVAEFLGHPVDPVFELYKSSLIIYNSATAPETVNKYCSALDIIPTLSNLFGLEYDSRLLMGRDIFSTAEPLVMFKDRSWITDKAAYNATAGTAVSLRGPAGTAVSEEYITQINNVVANRFNFSELILETDYYRKVVPVW